MNRLTSSLFVTPVLALLAGCAPSLDLPPPPDLEADERLEAFDNPTAIVVPQIMARVADEISDFRDELVRSSFYTEILEVIAITQDELYNDDGEVDLGGGLTFETPNGGVTVDYICEGWTDPPPSEPDPANGSIALNMRLTAGSIDALVWGLVEECKYPLQAGPVRLEAAYDGEIAIYFEEPIDADQSVYDLEATFLARGSIGVADVELPIDEVFQVALRFDDDQNVVLGRLNLLVELADGTSFVYSFDPELGQQLTDATGSLNCSLEDRRCFDDSGTVFSW